MKLILLLGRILFSLIFLMTALDHFSSSTITYASTHGVPAASVLVPLSGVIAIVGGLMILLGFKARLGAWLIVIFLVPATFIMHAYWKETNPALQQMQMGYFMKNLSMLGAALIITYFGSGPLSIDSAEYKQVI
jgi:putative oxidoreductase